MVISIRRFNTCVILLAPSTSADFFVYISIDIWLPKYIPQVGQAIAFFSLQGLLRKEAFSYSPHWIDSLIFLKAALNVGTLPPLKKMLLCLQ